MNVLNIESKCNVKYFRRPTGKPNFEPSNVLTF